MSQGETTYEVTLTSGRQVKVVVLATRVGPFGAIENNVPLRGRIPQGEEIFINPRSIETFREVRS